MSQRAFFSSGVALLAFLVITATSRALPLHADFDSVPEGSNGYTWIDGRIVFSDLFTPDGLRSRFVIEGTGESFFSDAVSLPNYLTTAGFAPGPAGGLGWFRSARITFPGAPASSVGMDIFAFTYDPPRTLLLEALLDGSVVATRSLVLGPPHNTAVSRFVSIHGVLFDELRLSTPDDSIHIGIDNVQIPEPTLGAVFVLCVLGSWALIRGRAGPGMLPVVGLIRIVVSRRSSVPAN